MRFAGVLVIVAACGAAPPRPRPTLQQFFRVHRAYVASLSPDASRVGFASNETGDWQVWVAPATGGAPRRLAKLAGDINGPFWSPAADDLLIASDRGGDQNYQLYLLGADGSPARPLTQTADVKHDVGGWSRDGASIFYASNARDRRYFDCHVMEVATRRDRLVLQRDAVMRCAALSPDGRSIAAVERRSEVEHQVYVADTATGTTRLITPRAARYRVVGFAPDGLYVITDLDRDFMNLAVIDLATGGLRFVEDTPHDTDVAVLSPDGHRIAVSRNVDGYEELSVLERGARVALPALPRGFVVPSAFSADGRKLAISINTPTHDDDVFLIDLDRRRLARVTSSDQGGLVERELVTPTLVRIPARDGFSIPAFLYLPRHAGARVPVIVAIHGGPEAQELPWFNASYQFFVSRGYAVLAPNIRGSTGYGKRYLALDNAERRWDALADVAAVVAWLRARRDVDPRRIVAFGYSYGGFMVLAMLAHYPDLFAAGVDLYGPSDLATFLGRTAEYRRAQRAAEYGTDPAFLAAISPARHVDKIKAPLLVIQGANDPIVPPAESRDLVEALRTRGRTVRYVEIPDEGHGFVKDASSLRTYDEMARFLERVLR